MKQLLGSSGDSDVAFKMLMLDKARKAIINLRGMNRVDGLMRGTLAGKIYTVPMSQLNKYIISIIYLFSKTILISFLM